MKLKKLHNTELECSEVILGSDYYGEGISEEKACEFMDYYIENGGNTIDTARLYTAGKSEELIGKYLAEKRNRHNIIISTKCGHPPLDNMNQNRLSRKEIESDIDKSLAALRTDYIDILWLHRDDNSVPVDEIVEILDSQVKKGKIRYFGASNWCGQRISMANDYAQKHKLVGMCASQIQWSCAKPAVNYDPTLVMMNKTEYKFYNKTKIPVFAFSAQGKGFFEKYDKNCLSQKAKDRFLCDYNIELYKKIKEVSLETGHSISAIVLSYLTKNTDFDTFPIINCSNLSQLQDSLSCTTVREKLIDIAF